MTVQYSCGSLRALLYSCRFGSRTDALSGRKGRRPPTFSAPRGPCFQPQVYHSSPLRPPWRTACAPFTPTTPAGLPECQGCPSFSSRRPLAVSRACHSRCHSAVSVRARHQTPWDSQTACPPMVRACSPTSTNHISLECRPLSPAPRTYLAPRSCVVPRTVTCGEGQALRRCGAKHWSTQCLWASLSDFWITSRPPPPLLNSQPQNFGPVFWTLIF